MNKTYTVKDVADILGYSTNSIYTFLKEKRIRGVRVGRGRFRIPEQELNRLLLIKNTPKAEVVIPATSIPLAPPAPIPVQPLVVVDIPSRISMPGIFEWFVAMAAIFLGFTLFLVSKTTDSIIIRDFPLWIWPLRVVLLCSGVGLLASYVLSKHGAIWRTIFYISAALGYGAFAAILASGQDYDGVILFASLAILLVIWQFVRLPNGSVFLIYLGVLSSIPCASLLWWREYADILRILPGLNMFGPMLPFVLLVYSFIVCAVLAYGYLKNKKFLWVGIWFIGAGCLGLAFWYASSLSWMRSFYFVMLTLVCFFFPVWHTIEVRHPHDRRAIVTITGSILFLFLFAALTIHLIQMNSLSYAKVELGSKRTYAAIKLESTVNSVEAAVLAAASNQSIHALLADLTGTKRLTASVREHRMAALQQSLRTVFESNGDMTELVIARADGTPISVYPMREIEGIERYDVASAVSRVKNTYLSQYPESFGSRYDNMIVVGAQVMQQDGEALVILGSINTVTIADSLQKVIDSGKQEYVMVTTSASDQIVAPMEFVSGSEIEKDEIAQLVSGDSNVRDDVFLENGERAMVAVESSDLGNDWRVVVVSPVSENIKLGNVSAMVVLGLVVLSVFIANALWMIRPVFKHIPKTGFNSS